MTQVELRPAPPAAPAGTLRGAVACTIGMAIVGTSVAMAPYLTDYPIMLGQAFRYLVAAITLLIVLGYRRQPFPRLRPGQWMRLSALAATGLVAFNWLLIEGAKRSDPSFLAAMVGATPVILALGGPLVARGRVQAWTIAGAATVAAGIVVVSGATSAPTAAIPYAVGFLLCEVAFTLIAVPLLREITPLQLSAAVCVVATPMLAVLATIAPGGSLRAPAGAELGALLYMAVLTTAVAFLLWYGGVVRLGADRAGLFCGVMPVAGFVAGVVLGTSAWSVTALAGVLLCAAGIAMGLSSRPFPGDQVDGMSRSSTSTTTTSAGSHGTERHSPARSQRNSS